MTNRYIIQAFDESENEYFALAAEDRYDDATKEAKRIAFRRDDEVRVLDLALKCEPWESNVVGTYGPEHYQPPCDCDECLRGFPSGCLCG